MIIGGDLPPQKQLFDDLENTDMSRAIHELGRALLVLHSPPMQPLISGNAEEIFACANQPRASFRWKTPTTSSVRPARLMVRR